MLFYLGGDSMRKTRSLGHRVLALFLCCVMVYGLIPTEAVALEPICGIEEETLS